MNEVVYQLTEQNKKISTMESCTGGFIASSITDVEGSSEVLSFSAVTYSNDAKIKLGVLKSTIDEYSVYSKNVAREMSFNIARIADSNYGIGITGKINKTDKFNLFGDDDKIYYSIYDKDNDIYYDFLLKALDDTRFNNKVYIKNEIVKSLLNILK